MATANPPSLPIARSKTAALTRVIDLVAKGYHFYFAGECPAERLPALVRKLHERYGIACSPAQRLTRKQKGLANAALVVFLPAEQYLAHLGADDNPAAPEAGFPVSEGDAMPAHATVTDELADKVLAQSVQTGREGESLSTLESAVACIDGKLRVAWLLLATVGTGMVHEQEQLRDVKGKHRLVFCGYELVRHSTRNKAAWTFRRTREEMANWFALLDDQLRRRRDDDVAQTLQRIAHQPGFAGVREQSWRLSAFARQRGYEGELPFLYFLQKTSQGERLLI